MACLAFALHKNNFSATMFHSKLFYLHYFLFNDHFCLITIELKFNSDKWSFLTCHPKIDPHSSLNVHFTTQPSSHSHPQKESMCSWYLQAELTVVYYSVHDYCNYGCALFVIFIMVWPTDFELHIHHFFGNNLPI